MAPDNVTDTELAILQVLWEQGPATIRQIMDRLYPDGKTSEYATVQSLLQRLEAKDYVRRDRRSFAHVFRAKVARERFIDQRLQELAEKLCGGSLTPLLIHLAEGTRLTPEQRRMLHQLIDESSRKG